MIASSKRTVRFIASAVIAFVLVSAALCIVGCRSRNPEASPDLHVAKDAAFTDFFRRTNGWVAGDGAISVPLPDGRSLWLFGDSHIDTYNPKEQTVPCLFQARNAGLLQNKNSFTDAKTLSGPGPGFRSLFKRVKGDDPWFWPLHGFAERDAAYIYLAELKAAGTGTFGFAATGHDYFAKMDLPGLRVREYIPAPRFDGRGFGLGFVREKDGYVYTYSSKGTKIGTELYAARFKSGQLDRDWNFWDGAKWTTLLSNAAPIFRSYAVSLSVCKVRNKYILIGSALSVRCDMGRDILIATSDSPTGPFSPMRKIYTIDDTVDGHVPFFYLPMVHPEFINRKNELLVTYSINGYEPCVTNCVNGHMNPDYYRPRAIRVPLRLIDPGIK